MKRIPLFVLLFLVSCQEITTPRTQAPSSITNADNEISSLLLNGPWKRNYQACDLTNTNCTNIDIVVDFVSLSEVRINTYYAGTLNPYGMRELNFEVEKVISPNEFVMFEYAYGSDAPRLKIKTSITGNKLKFCEDGMCSTYFRVN
jgi:hypothetical protein